MRPGDLQAQVAFLSQRIRGARVLVVGASPRFQEALREVGAAAVVAWDPDATGALDEADYDLAWIPGDAGGAGDLPLEALAATTRGWLVCSLPGDGAAYSTWVRRLRARFPSVEVAVQSPVAGSFLTLWGQDRPGVHVDGRYGPAPTISSYLLIAGAEPCGLSGQLLVPLLGNEALEARLFALEEALAAERLRADALEGALRSERERPRGGEPEGRRVEALERRVRELREREEMARSRALEAEERLREVERRLEAEQASRADASVALRGEILRAERAQRDAEGVMDAVSERDRRIAILEGRL